MAAGHDAHDTHDHDAHDDDHGHDDHGSTDDGWVLVPLAVGLLIGLVLAGYFGLASGAAPFS